MSEESKPTLISLARAKAAARSQKADDSVTNPDRMLQLADTIISHHNLVIDSSAASSSYFQVFSLDDTINLLTPVDDGTLENYIFQAEPRHVVKGRQEVAHYVRRSLASSVDRQLDVTKVAAIAFADEADKLTFKRFPYTREQAMSITLEQIPGFAHVISLTSDANALCLWLGSLLDSGSSRSQYLHWYGGGGNGKSTVFQAISHALGHSRVVHTRFEDFKASHWGTELLGARLLLFPDANDKRGFSNGKFKELTGEEYLMVNPKGKPYKKIPLTHKTAVLSNRHVAITNDAADKRRLLPIVSKEDTETDHGNKWWYADVKNNGDLILLYCYRIYQEAVAADPSIRAYIPPNEETQAEAVEERYGYLLAVIEEIVEHSTNEADTLKATKVYESIAFKLDKTSLNSKEQGEIKEALLAMNIRATRLGEERTRSFINCKMKGKR